MIENPSLFYAEGYAQYHGVRLAHVWAVTPEGTVIDPTWETPGDAYFGCFMTETRIFDIC